MNDEKIELEILYGSKELWRTYLAAYFDLSGIFYMFFSFFVFGFSLSVYFFGKRFELSYFGDVILFSLLFTLSYGFVMSYFSIRNTQKLKLGKYKFGISNESIEVVTGEFRTETNWSWFSRAKETGKYFLLYSKDGQPHVLPKRFFDEEQTTNFKDLLRAKLGAEAYLKKEN